jgi:hypothetical protein
MIMCYVLFCLLLVPVIALAQDEYILDKDVFCGTGLCADAKGNPVTGKVKSYHANGKLAREDRVKHGKQEGLARDYYRSGKISAETPFKDGEIEGVAREYYENGNLRTEFPFKDSELDGLAKLYREDGTLHVEQSHRKGKKEGEAKLHLKNGAVLAFIYKTDAAVSGYCVDKHGEKRSYPRMI